jgi:hypothetical protein
MSIIELKFWGGLSIVCVTTRFSLKNLAYGSTQKELDTLARPVRSAHVKRVILVCLCAVCVLAVTGCMKNIGHSGHAEKAPNVLFLSTPELTGTCLDE